MGWFKKLTNYFERTFIPEGEILGIDWATGSPDEQAARASTKANEAAAAAPKIETPTAGTLSDEELQAEAQKRLASLGKYFTSPLGVLQGASTGSQRTFS